MRMTIFGCGNMGSALAHRLAPHHQLFLYDRSFPVATKLAQDNLGLACQNVEDSIKASDVIFLAVKPQNLAEAADSLRHSIKKEQIIVSLLAGTPLRILKTYFPENPILRMMPNLAITYGEGIIGLSSNETFSEEKKKQWVQIFEPLGHIYWFSEDKMNPLTSLASSGPSFFFSMMEAMVDAGTAMGFEEHVSRSLVHQMIRGSLALLEKSGGRPEELSKKIASPGGTTEAGLKKMKQRSVRDGIIDTFFAANDRAKELENNSSQ